MEMNARRQPEAPELDVEALLGKLTNVNKVHVACRGIVKPSTTAAEAAGSGVTLSKEIAAVRCVFGAGQVFGAGASQLGSPGCSAEADASSAMLRCALPASPAQCSAQRLAGLHASLQACLVSVACSSAGRLGPCTAARAAVPVLTVLAACCCTNCSVLLPPHVQPAKSPGKSCHAFGGSRKLLQHGAVLHERGGCWPSGLSCVSRHAGRPTELT